MIVAYGIRNCDTMRSAMGWLDRHHIAYSFHDYRKIPVTSSKLKQWCKEVGWESLVNRKGLTYRKLTDEVKATLTTETAAVRLMSEQPTIIRRPLLELNDRIIAIGFDEDTYGKVFSVAR